jgi:integrase
MIPGQPLRPLAPGSRVDKTTGAKFRDTFATLHLTDDYSRLPWVSRQLGHETERTTIDHYYGFLPTKASEQFANRIR